MYHHLGKPIWRSFQECHAAAIAENSFVKEVDRLSKSKLKVRIHEKVVLTTTNLHRCNRSVANVAMGY
jgi:hypothetical protein